MHVLPALAVSANHATLGLSAATQQLHRVPTGLFRSHFVCVCTHTEMYKHIQEEKAEKYVNLKHLANVSELTRPRFGLLGVFFCWGESRKRKQFCHSGPGKEGA